MMADHAAAVDDDVGDDDIFIFTASYLQVLSMI